MPPRLGRVQSTVFWTLGFTAALALQTVLAVRGSTSAVDRLIERTARWTEQGSLAAVTRPAVEDVGWLGTPVVSLHLVTVLVVIMLLRGWRVQGALLLASFATAVLAELAARVVMSDVGWHEVVKTAITGHAAVAVSSFPSGHVARAVLAVAAAAAFLPSRLRPAGFVAAAVVGVVTGLSRLQAGLHQGTDIVGGLVLGAALASAWITLLPFGLWLQLRLWPGLRVIDARNPWLRSAATTDLPAPAPATRGMRWNAAIVAGALALALASALTLGLESTVTAAMNRALADFARWLVAGPAGAFLRPVVQPGDELGVTSPSVCLAAILAGVLVWRGQSLAAWLLVGAVIGLSIVLAVLPYPSVHAARVMLLTAVEAALLPRRWRAAGVGIALLLGSLAVLSRVDSGITGSRAVLGSLVGGAAAIGWLGVTGFVKARLYPNLTSSGS